MSNDPQSPLPSATNPQAGQSGWDQASYQPGQPYQSGQQSWAPNPAYPPAPGQPGWGQAPSQGWENTTAQVPGWENSYQQQPLPNQQVPGWETSSQQVPGWETSYQQVWPAANQQVPGWETSSQQVPGWETSYQQPWPAAQPQNPQVASEPSGPTSIGEFFSRLLDLNFAGLNATGFHKSLYVLIAVWAVLAWLLPVIFVFSLGSPFTGLAWLLLVLGWISSLIVVGLGRTFIELALVHQQTRDAASWLQAHAAEQAGQADGDDETDAAQA